MNLAFVVAAVPPVLVPLLVLLALGAIVLLASWTSSSRKQQVGTAGKPQERGAATQGTPGPTQPAARFGLLEPVSRHLDEAGAAADRARLRLHGVRATVGREGEEHLVLVFRSDVRNAKHILAREAS